MDLVYGHKNLTLYFAKLFESLEYSNKKKIFKTPYDCVLQLFLFTKQEEGIRFTMF